MYYCEYALLLKKCTEHTCMSAIYYDQESKIKVNQCKTIVTFDNTLESKILDAGNIVEKDVKDKDAKRLVVEKAQTEALIEKHRPRTPKTPDKMNTMGTGKNANTNGQKGIEKGKLPHKKAMKASQIKMFQNKCDKANKGKPDALLGDPTVNTKVHTYKAKEKGQTDKVGVNDIGIFEFILHGLPNPPDLEGMDEDRLRELQNAIQEQLHQRDEERERNITKRVQEFEKTFDFVNSHLLKGVATMAELTKTDNRQPIGKIKPTDKNGHDAESI